MMHTTSSCNSFISIRTYPAFNNYSNERCPSNYCSCCCSFPINSCKLLVPTNPSYLYGLRQSTLIYWPPSRRLILGSSDRCVARSSIYNVGRCCFSESCCVKQERLDRIIRSSMKNCCVNKEKSVDINRIKNKMDRPRRDLKSNALGDAEAMLSLLTEGIVEERVVVREKKRSSFQQGKVGSKPNVVIANKDRKPNVDSGYRDSDPKKRQLESCRVPSGEEGPKREEERENLPKDKDRRLGRRESRNMQNVVLEKVKDRKQHVDYGYKESELTDQQLEPYRVPSREEGCKREEERENHPKDEDRRSRRRESSSSYYSLSDSEDDLESDEEVEVKQDQFVGESSVSRKKDSRKSGGVLSSEKTEKDREICKDEKQKVLQSSRNNDFRVGSSIQRDWRKKSEKKLTEEFEETKSRNDSVARKSQLSHAQESSSKIDSSSEKQHNFQEEQLISDVKSFGQSSSHIVKNNRASIYSKSSRQDEYSIKNNREDVETPSTTWRRSSQGKDSKIVGRFQEAGCDYCETCGRSMEKKKTQSDIQQHVDPSEETIDAELTLRGEHFSESSRQRKHGKGSSSLQSSDEESRQHDQIHILTGQASATRKSQHYRESISAGDSCTQSNWIQQSEAGPHRLVEKSRTTAASQSGSRLKEDGKSSSSLQISAREEHKEHDGISLATGKVDTRRKSQRYSEIMDTDASYLHSTLRPQQQAETQKKQEEKTTSLTSEEVKRLRKESSGKITKDVESSKMSHSRKGESQVDSSNLEINSQSASEKKVYNEQTHTKLKLKSVEEILEKRKWIDETTVQSTIQTDVQGPSTGHFAEEATITQPLVPSISQTGVQQLRGEEVKSKKLSVTSPPYQIINPLSQFPETSTSSVRKDTGRTTKVGSDSMAKHAQVSCPSSHGEVNFDGSKSDYSPEDVLLSAAHMQESSSLFVGEFVEKMSHEASTSESSIEKKSSNADLKHQDENNRLKRSTQLDYEDALVSAARMQESSSLIYGDFVEKVSQEASNSETKIEKKLSKASSKHQDIDHMLKGSTESDSDKTGSQKHVSDNSSLVSGPDSGEANLHKPDSKCSSGDSGTKEPSDQMWDVKDHFVQESSEIEPLEGATSESITAARPGKSLWNTVTGALRLRWGSSENQKSPVKRQSSPSRSGSGETWFSENEADQTNDDGLKEGEIRVLQENSSNQSLIGSTKSQKEDIVVMSLDGQSSHVDVGASSSSSVLQSSSPSGVVIGEDINLYVAEHLSQPSALVDLSTPSRQLRRSFAFEEDDEAEKIEAPTSSSDEQRNSSVEVRQTDDSASAETNIDLKRRKLQRSKLVLQRYDDWEDAYRRTREQRKVDEIFMREALSEAIKAAESWEVPVGAVLVHNGNIIARGYNLVEELRDSTAHAEMLCIREASNVLRTWRLSETTLYVTLEPCPMCAGAILQARINTLVWGAPNKLLGADGSWIRLFPAGDEEHSEATDMPAAPVHPFHPNMKIRRGILEDECADIMQQFFQLRRRKAKEKKAETSSEESVQPSCFPRPHHRPRLLHKMHNIFHLSKQRAD